MPEPAPRVGNWWVTSARGQARVRNMIDMPDDVLMLALCVQAERLADPAGWCREFRSLVGSAATSTEDAEAQRDRWERLAVEARA